MAKDILSGGLKNYEAKPTDGVVQTFNETAKSTPAEMDDNKTQQHKVPGPDHNDLGAKNDLNG